MSGNCGWYPYHSSLAIPITPKRRSSNRTDCKILHLGVVIQVLDSNRSLCPSLYMYKEKHGHGHYGHYANTGGFPLKAQNELEIM